MTEREKMLAGKLYDISDSELVSLYKKAGRLCKDYNDTYLDEDEKRKAILKELVPDMGEGSGFRGPIQFDYGINTHIGKNSFANYNFTVLDCAPVTIGDDVFIGPNVTLGTPVHPLLNEERRSRYKADGTKYDHEYAKPITIKDGCWLASGVIVCGGVTIGKECVIGAGSVVTRDIPDGVFAAGNPCRVIRKITQEDSVYLKKELF